MGKDDHMLQNTRTYTFRKYTFCDLRLVFNTAKGTYLAPIQEGSVQYKTMQDFCIVLKKIEKNTYQILHRTPKYLHIQKGINVHLCTERPSLSLSIFAR